MMRYLYPIFVVVVILEIATTPFTLLERAMALGLLGFFVYRWYQGR
jgi:hypothetical protein